MILLAGLVLGNLAQSVVTRAGSTANLAYADAAGRAAKAGIVLLAGVVALDQIGIDSTLLILITAIVIGVVLGGLALAFGLGARGVVSNIIASHYMNQAYRVGQRIRVGDVEGRIDEIQPAYLVIDGVEGRVLVPARQLVEKVSVLLHEESSAMNAEWMLSREFLQSHPDRRHAGSGDGWVRQCRGLSCGG